MDRPAFNRSLRKGQELQSVRRTSVHEITRDRAFVGGDCMRPGEREPIACRPSSLLLMGHCGLPRLSLGKRVDKGAPEILSLL